MTATTERCPGCHGSGIEMSGVTYAGMSEYVGCHECGPECPDDCGCRVDAEPERPESIAPRHPGATQSPDGSQGATEGLRGPERAVTDAEAAECARLAIDAELPWSIAVPRLLADRERLTAALASEVEVAEVGKAFHRLVVAERDFERGKNDRLRVQRDGLRATVRSMLGDAAAEGRCGCVALCEGPQEDCPLHGRDYAWWVGLAGTACADREWLMAENARLVEEATVSAALLETEIAKREAAEMRANRATADLDALESEDRRQDVQAKHWREVLRIRRELDGIRQEMNDATEIIAKALGYRPSGLPLDGWPHLSTTGDHTPTSLAAEAAGVLAKASRLRAGIEALAAEMQSDTCPACHAYYADEGSTTWGCDHTEGMQHAGDMLRALLAEGGE